MMHALRIQAIMECYSIDYSIITKKNNFKIYFKLNVKEMMYILKNIRLSN